MEDISQVEQRIWYFSVLASGMWILTRFVDSDVIYVNLAGTSVIVLNTYEAAMELLEKRSSIYSSRYASNRTLRVRVHKC